MHNLQLEGRAGVYSHHDHVLSSLYAGGNFFFTPNFKIGAHVSLTGLPDDNTAFGGGAMAEFTPTRGPFALFAAYDCLSWASDTYHTVKAGVKLRYGLHSPVHEAVKGPSLGEGILTPVRLAF